MGDCGSLSSTALMQIAYWACYRVRPPLAQFQNALLGHAILFLARMIYVVPTAIFGFVFIAQRPEFIHDAGIGGRHYRFGRRLAKPQGILTPFGFEEKAPEDNNSRNSIGLLNPPR
jgi:hypothetical protein